MPTTAPDLTTLAVSGKGTSFFIQSALISGVVATSGTGVTYTSGTNFVTGSSWVGQQITINGVIYTIASVTSTTALVLTASAGTQTGVNYSFPAYTPVAELKTLSASGSKNDIEDVTNFDSAGRFKEYIVTLADSGDYSIAGNYITSDNGQNAFRGAFNAGTVLSYKIILPLQAGQTTAGETWTFKGIVEELDNTVEYSKVISFQAKLKITGAINVVLGS
jgi:predicted secreted protein